jgi:hypothetical protein
VTDDVDEAVRIIAAAGGKGTAREQPEPTGANRDSEVYPAQ